jgi:hypothetical protein
MWYPPIINPLPSLGLSFLILFFLQLINFVPSCDIYENWFCILVEQSACQDFIKFSNNLYPSDIIKNTSGGVSDSAHKIMLSAINAINCANFFCTWDGYLDTNYPIRVGNWINQN